METADADAEDVRRRLHKIYRGLIAAPGSGEAEFETREIPWLAVMDGFAIGGGCQILLVVDHVLAERGATFNLPARKEGIIAGCARLDRCWQAG